jgi:hypothetical protein
MWTNDCTVNTYIISRWTWKWIKKLLFHQLDLTVLSSYILNSCGAKLSHRYFWLIGAQYRRVEWCLELRLHYRECQPFLPASWKWDTTCIGSRKEQSRGVICSARKKLSRAIYICTCIKSYWCLKCHSNVTKQTNPLQVDNLMTNLWQS